MMDHEIDPLVDALAALPVTAPPTLAARVFSAFVVAPSRIGEVFVATTAEGVHFVRSAESVHGEAEEFREDYRRRYGRPLRPAERPLRGLLPALRGRRAPSLELDLRGLSEFARHVLAATRTIPTGETRPYAWIAREAGRPTAVRATASVLARNPVPLLIPCHRVVRSDGPLGEYIFGSDHKEELLRSEGVNVDEVQALLGAGVHFLGSDTTGVVCFPTCHQARRITTVHRHGFATMATALEAGYRPCRHCRPARLGPG